MCSFGAEILQDSAHTGVLGQAMETSLFREDEEGTEFTRAACFASGTREQFRRIYAEVGPRALHQPDFEERRSPILILEGHGAVRPFRFRPIHCAHSAGTVCL